MLLAVAVAVWRWPGGPDQKPSRLIGMGLWPVAVAGGSCRVGKFVDPKARGRICDLDVRNCE